MKSHMLYTVGRRSVIAGASGGAVLAALNAPAAFAAGTPPTTVTRYGKAIAFGNGYVRMYARVQMGQTRSLGLFISDEVMVDLPDHDEGHGPADGQTIIPMVPGIKDVAIRHATIGWNPHGHEPQSFELPHFDFHFYFITNAQRQLIDPSRADFVEKANAPVPDGVMPQDFVPTLPPHVPFVNGTVPFMGFHWADMFRSAVMTGSLFEHEFINGSWDGRWTFLEPMITRDWFNSHESHAEPIKQPQVYSYPGSYPTQLNLFHSGEHQGWIIALREFEARG